MTEAAKSYIEKMFAGNVPAEAADDPEFAELFGNFAFDEVVNQDELDDKTRFLAILATLHGCQGIDAYRVMAPAALNFGVTPAELKEITYQAAAYLGIGRVLPFLRANNELLRERGIALPLSPQGTTTRETRREAGTQAQVDIFGDSMRDFWCSGPEETRHINRWLAANCFGDYYTRGTLDYRQREMITLCFLSAQGGCEPQLISHALANLGVGNDKSFLIRVVSQCMPYIGYPRTLNALSCIRKAAAKAEKTE